MEKQNNEVVPCDELMTEVYFEHKELKAKVTTLFLVI